MFRLALAVLCFSTLALAGDKAANWERKTGERPAIREPGEDKKLFGELSAEKFFEKRREDAKCVADFEKAEKSHRDFRKALRKLIQDGAKKEDIQKSEEAWLKARVALLPLLEKCGPCATRPVEYEKIRGSKGPEHWYVADGSCWVGKPNKYETASVDLEKLSRYARKDDGFTALLNFDAFDKDGTKIPADKRLPTEDAKDPTFVFLAMRADPGVGLTMAFTHLFQSEFRRRDEGRWVVLKTPAGETKVPEIAEPELKDLSLGGKEAAVKRFRVKEAFGTWYLTKDGYVRYTNAGDFGGQIPFLDREGRKLVQDVIYEMVERMRGE